MTSITEPGGCNPACAAGRGRDPSDFESLLTSFIRWLHQEFAVTEFVSVDHPTLVQRVTLSSRTVRELLRASCLLSVAAVFRQEDFMRFGYFTVVCLVSAILPCCGSMRCIQILFLYVRGRWRLSSGSLQQISCGELQDPPESQVSFSDMCLGQFRFSQNLVSRNLACFSVSSWHPSCICFHEISSVAESCGRRNAAGAWISWMR